MGFFKSAHPERIPEQTRLWAERCMEEIIQKIARISGIDGCIRLDGGDVAFSGSKEKPELQLELSIMSGVKKGGRLHFLYASLDDEISWQEWDFEKTEAFADAIAEHIGPLVEQTVKFVSETKKFRYVREAVYCLDQATGEWIKQREETADYPLLRLFLWKDKRTEYIKTYHMDN